MKENQNAYQLEVLKDGTITAIGWADAENGKAERQKITQEKNLIANTIT